MKIIAEISDKIECLIREAEEYIDCANSKKDIYPMVAETYFKLSEQRMKDQAILHEVVVNLIEEYKKTKSNPPENMKFLYEFLHQKFENWAARVKIKQNMYKSNT